MGWVCPSQRQRVFQMTMSTLLCIIRADRSSCHSKIKAQKGAKKILYWPGMPNRCFGGRINKFSASHPVKKGVLCSNFLNDNDISATSQTILSTLSDCKTFFATRTVKNPETRLKSSKYNVPNASPMRP